VNEQHALEQVAAQVNGAGWCGLASGLREDLERPSELCFGILGLLERAGRVQFAVLGLCRIVQCLLGGQQVLGSVLFVQAVVPFAQTSGQQHQAHRNAASFAQAILQGF
jgi:hypothetical protein